MTAKTSSVDRFWKSVDKNGPIHPICGQCWVWIAGKDGKGYGVMSVVGGERRMHRYSWSLHFGVLGKGVCVLHHCDNPACVNPKHLFLGTRTDNNLDRDRKGHKGDHTGELNGRAILTKEQVEDIRARYKSTSPGHGNGRSLAREFGVSRSTIQQIINGSNWRKS